MRKSTLYLGLTTIGALFLFVLIGIQPIAARNGNQRRLANERALVERLQLTDIALFTEASHTRHPNLADRFGPFQNHPMALSQFPSESLVAPPAHLHRSHTAVDQEGSP